MKRENFGTYIGVRKMKWDAMWHAIFTYGDGKESWDRVTKERAMEIADNLWN